MGKTRRLRTFPPSIRNGEFDRSRPSGMNLRKYVPPATATRTTAMTASAAPFPIEETTIAALHAAYVSGRATAVSVCQAHLDRIAAYDQKGPALGAIIINNPDALADAAALDAALASTGKLVGPLHGIPVLVKDNYDVAGLQTTGGSAALLGWLPEADATVIARIRGAGGIILAKTTMSEWARGGLDNINSVLILPTYTAFLKLDGARGRRIGVFRQAFRPDASDPQ